jgi:hypothetical protein
MSEQQPVKMLMLTKIFLCILQGFASKLYMRRKKIFYTPGLISLLGLYPLLIIYPIGEVKIETYIKFFLASDKKASTEHFVPYSKYNVYEAIKNKKIVYVNVHDNDFNSDGYIHNAKMNFIKSEIERLQFTYDTASVLKIELGDENTYGDFVWILNRALIYRLQRYAFVDNCFYFFPN